MGDRTGKAARLEQSQGPEELLRVLAAFDEWLKGPEWIELWRSLVTWLEQEILAARMPGLRIPKMADLLEVKSMLAERIKEWTQTWKQEGFNEGPE